MSETKISFIKKIVFCFVVIIFLGTLIFIFKDSKNSQEKNSYWQKKFSLVDSVSAESSYAGINIDLANLGCRPSAQDIKNLGAGWIRFVYKQGVTYDAYIDSFYNNGVRILLILNPETISLSTGVVDDNYINNFAARAAEIAGRFGGKIAAYEIWNEQDLHAATSVYIEPTTYAKLLKKSYSSIKAVNPSATVIIGGLGLASQNLTQGLNYLDTVVASAGGSYDAVGVHPYNPTVSVVVNMVNGYRNHSGGKPVWVTEFGYGWEASDQTKANYLTGVCNDLKGKVSNVMWYSWTDAMGPGYGLVDTGCNQKQTYFAFQRYCGSVSSTPAPSVDIKANNSDGPITISYNTSTGLSWTSTNSTSCIASNGWSGTKGTSGSESTGNLTVTRTYTITCTGAGGSANDSVTVNVSVPVTPPTVDIKANGSDGPITIDYNTVATLSWTSTNASSCSASNGWSGGKTTSDSESTGNLTASKTYTISCAGTGDSVSDSVTINVGAPPTLPPPSPQPTVDIKANGSDGPITIDYNAAVALSWISANSTSCTASNGWSGQKNTSGSENMGNLTTSKTYALSCTGAGGTASDSVTVNVLSPTPIPTVDIKVNGYDDFAIVTYNGSAILSWNSTNTTFCNALDGWSGTKTTQGMESTENLTTSKTYTLSCTGAGGTASDSVNVNIGTPPFTPCPYGSIQTRVHKTDYEPWTNSITLYPNEEFKGAVFENGWGVLTNDGRLKIWGPGFSQSYDNAGNDDLYERLSLPNIGNYTVRGEIIDLENQSGCYEEISIRVISPPTLVPTVDIKANSSDGPINIDYDSSARLSWESINISSCIASDGWYGAKETFGSESTGNLTSTRTYTITCMGSGGQVIDSVTVNVGELPIPSNCPYYSTQARVHKTEYEPWINSIILYPNEEFRAGIFKNDWGILTSNGRLKISGPNGFFKSYDNGGDADLFENLSLPYAGDYTAKGEIIGYENQLACYEEILILVITHPSLSSASTDLNNDGKTDIKDYNILLQAWGTSSATTDLNSDGIIDAKDLEIMRRKIQGIQ